MTTEPRRTESAQWSPRLPIELSEAPDVTSAAAMLAHRGIPVFPCAPYGKQPLTPHGFHDASTERIEVEAWWQRWPHANIGLPTGAASGVEVVDVDVHAGGNGFAAFERARSAGLADGWAWLVRTPSGGVHAYYLCGSTEEQRSWQVPSQHVDFRGDGGYIVAPPSRVMGADGQTRAYELIAVAQHAAKPVDAVSLKAFLDPPRPPRPPAGMPRVGARPDKLAAWVAARPEGARNHGLFWAACRMVEEGHPFDSTANLLGDAARSAGLPDQEAITTIRSAYRVASRLGAATITRPTRAAEVVAL
jgi:hypothetical protein